MFPGTLLQPNYADPENEDRLIGRTEVERRGEYINQLEHLLPGDIRQQFVQLVKDCLQNDPRKRPMVDQLVTSLEEMRGDIEGSYGKLATLDAVRQVMTMRQLSECRRGCQEEVRSKNAEIRQLQQQLEVSNS